MSSDILEVDEGCGGRVKDQSDFILFSSDEVLYRTVEVKERGGRCDMSESREVGTGE
jgi:hypothetical protein